MKINDPRFWVVIFIVLVMVLLGIPIYKITNLDLIIQKLFCSKRCSE